MRHNVLEVLMALKGPQVNVTVLNALKLPKRP